MELASGAVIADRYRVEFKIGTGGMGEVWAGEHIAIGGQVAIKTLLPAKAARSEMVTRFRREAQFLGRIQSDHVARVLDFISDPNYGLVLVMEYVEGDALSAVLRERVLSVEQAIEPGTDIATGLRDLHKAEVVHRDLKPANIILRPLGEERTRATIVDFGVSRSTRPTGDGEESITRITRSHMALGTAEYMSPEQFLNARDASIASDVYALGAILYRAVTGQHVFGKTRGRALAEKKIGSAAPGLRTGRVDRLARGLEAVVAKALKRLPSERYQSAEELLAALVPLRELTRVAALELEATSTTDGQRLLAREIFELEPVPLDPSREVSSEAEDTDESTLKSVQEQGLVGSVSARDEAPAASSEMADLDGWDEVLSTSRMTPLASPAGVAGRKRRQVGWIAGVAIGAACVALGLTIRSIVATPEPPGAVVQGTPSKSAGSMLAGASIPAAATSAQQPDPRELGALEAPPTGRASVGLPPTTLRVGAADGAVGNPTVSTPILPAGHAAEEDPYGSHPVTPVPSQAPDVGDDVYP